MRRIAIRAIGIGVLGALGVACGTSDSALPDPPPGCQRIDPEGGGDEPVPPDGPSLCRQGACNYQTQSGCPENRACRPNIDQTSETITPACAPVGTSTAGEPCTMWENECARGLFCFDGACRKLCCGGDWTACDEGESCIRQVSARINGNVVDAGVDLCFPVGTCDVLTPGSCDDEPGRECRIVDPTGAVACAPNSAIGLGEPCNQANQCDEGLHCVAGRCRKLCRAEECGEPGCDPGETCVHFDRDPTGVGECTPGWKIGAGSQAE